MSKRLNYFGENTNLNSYRFISQKKGCPTYHLIRQPCGLQLIFLMYYYPAVIGVVQQKPLIK